MIDFNSLTLRYKFIYLTKNVYEGIAINDIFDELRGNIYGGCLVKNEVKLFLIDKYIKFIPFSLRFDDVYRLKEVGFESDIILSLNNKEAVRLAFVSILFFVDMYNPEKISFLYLHGVTNKSKVQELMSVFLRHCYAIVKGKVESQREIFFFNLRQQQLVFYLLKGYSIKKVAQEVNVSDKTLYNDKAKLIRKMMSQQKLRLTKASV